ncbi:MAG: peptidylprolyl isomerase [Candidatus Neoclostridium sp.]
MTEISIIMEDGSVMNARLYEDKAPKTVENFLSLVENRFFDGLCFHRVIPDFMIQGGGFIDQNGELVHKEAPNNVVGEFAANGFKGNDLHHAEGVLSMARAMDKNSASSQFFICVADCGYLDGQYAAFGALSDENSLAVAKAISTAKTTSVGYYNDVPVYPIVIKTIKIK